MKIALLLMLAVLLCALQTANTTRDKALESLAVAERNFAATSAKKGFHKAFAENMADDGIVFAPTPTNGKKLHADAPESKALLTWYPAYADISASLDWGYTTGPYEFKVKPEDEKPAGTGFYLSVWRKQPDGQWKVAVDMGNSFSPDLIKPETYKPAPAIKETIGKGSEKDLLASDVQKVQPYYDETLIYRHGEYPYRYKNTPIEPAATIVYTTLGHELSPSADMGYTYGSYKQGETTGHYLKVWKMLNAKWKLVAHNLVPDKK
jgi:ketosteroid isomerase-like protein